VLTGTVAFFSKSTQTVVQDIVLAAEGSPIGKGKVSSAVGEAPPSMPSIGEIQRAGVGLDLRDRVVLITGASRGLGETTAKVFGLLGARVGVSYLSGGEDAARIVHEIEEAGGQAVALQADVTDAAAVEAMVAALHDRFGRIDVLVNNAVRDTRPIPFSALTWDEMQADIDVTLKGAFHCCKAVIPRMVAAGGGRIVNVGTVIAEVPQTGQMKYVVSKSALVGFTRSLALEHAPSNVLVNMVVPSMVETDLSQSIPRMLRAGMKNDTPMRRLATPLDVARAIVFLASDLSGYTTGQKIMVTGGSPPFL
jgi:3-oxoacyl-[acyl-carrier protein] reductase